MDNSLTTLIDSSASILIVLPVKPNFDAVSAGMSFYLSAKNSKSMSITCPTPMMVGFNRVIGINKISAEPENKNLTIKFKDYDATSIEKVSYDIVGGEFNLTVVPKAGFVAPQKDQLNLTYTGSTADLVILIGGMGDSDFPILQSSELNAAKVAHIGNRVLATTREVMSFAKSGASISEVVTGIIREAGMEMDSDIATNLVMGIEEGSSNFASAEVTPETFEAFAYLLRNGGVRKPKTNLSPINFPPGAIPTKPFTPTQSGFTPKPVIKDVQPAVQDVEGTKETEQDVNPPEDWLSQPKVYKGTSVS